MGFEKFGKDGGGGAKARTKLSSNSINIIIIYALKLIKFINYLL